MNTPKVLVTTPSTRENFQSLSRYAQLYWLDDIDVGELDGLLPAIDSIFAFNWPKTLDAQRLARMEKLRFIQSELAGVNNVPFQHLDKRVVVSSNAGGYSHEVAEYAWALLLAAAKKIVRYNAAVRAPNFVRPSAPELGKEVVVLKGKTLGVIGYGGIGRTVATMGKAFGMKVCAFSRRATDDGVDPFHGRVGLVNLLRSSDACVLALPLSKLTAGMIGADELAVMKSDAIMVNVGRGEVLNEKALYDHLAKNPAFTYATDVWWTVDGRESFSPRFPFLELHNFIGTPHASGPSALVTGAPVRHAIANLVRFLSGETPENVVDRSEYV